MDWTLCVICQKNTAEPLSSPQHSANRRDPLCVYRDFIKNLTEFEKLNKLPVQSGIGSADISERSAEKFLTNKALWHRSCHQKFNNSKLQRERDRKRKLGIETDNGKDATDDGIHRSKRQRVERPRESIYCIFCDQSSGKLHQYSTLSADNSLRTMSQEMQDLVMMAKICGGDLVAIGARYHLQCLTAYRNKYRSHCRQHESRQNIFSERNKSRAFAELATYVEESLEVGISLFKLSELHNLYERRLKDLNEDVTINKTRLKEKLLNYFSSMGLQEQSDGKNTVLVFPKGMQQMLKDGYLDRNGDNEALLLTKVARICRKEILSVDTSFSGAFLPNCQRNITPITSQLVSMILYGSNIEDEAEESQACLTISQLLLFNSKKQGKQSSAQNRHCLEREPPLPLYIGLNIHSKTRSKGLVDQMAKLGISVSYDRVCQVENNLALSVCQQFNEDGVVCPSNLRKGIFTVGALDNIDHNPSSTTAEGSLHGTGISIMQFPTKENGGTCREAPYARISNSKQKPTLPDTFTYVPPIQLNDATTVPFVTSTSACTAETRIEQAMAKEKDWIKHSMELLKMETLRKGQPISWAAYHASLQPPAEHLPSIIALLPLFLEKADSPAMVKHGLDVLRNVTNFLNDGQIPVLACDCPIFAICKKIQWSMPQLYGEDKFLIMFGGLHIEKSLWNALGDLLRGSGWTNVLTEAGIATSGTADSFLKAAHITRTRHMHQVTALTLAKLQQDAFTKSEEQNFEKWRQAMIEGSPTFRFWDLILKIEITVLAFIRSHRERDFTLYVECLQALMFLFFALDHVNYSRWVSVHLRDMQALPEKLKNTFNKFWVIQKTCKRFSAIPIDQAHEQENAKVKGSGGVVGLTENPVALCRWLICGPELARIVTQFGEQYMPETNPVGESVHYEEGLSHQIKFQLQVNNFVNEINRYGNPFDEKGQELLVLNTRECADDVVATTVRTIEDLGKRQFEEFNREVLKERTKPISATIKRNSLPLFSTTKHKVRASANQIKAMQDDVELFSHLYISTQQREGDLDEFFSHENHAYPPSLSEYGKLRLGAKSDLLKLLQDAETKPDDCSFECRIFDGGALIHIFNPKNAGLIFSEYSNQVFLPFLKRELLNAKRVDIVSDRYLPDSLKNCAREKRGSGVRVNVGPQARVPNNWHAFLRDTKNKEELLNFLSEEVSHAEWDDSKEIYVTKGTYVITKGSAKPMLDCTHGEADTRVIVHLLHALENERNKIEVRTVETDIVVLLIGQFFEMQARYPQVDIWVAFGVGKNFQYIHVNSICWKLGKEKSQSLPVFHAFSGCDTTSSFCGKGKRTALQAWKSYPEATEAFLYIQRNPFATISCSSPCFQKLERLTVLMYDKSSNLHSVNAARRELFSKKGKPIENIPPTQVSGQKMVSA